MRLLEWRAEAPTRDALGPRVLAVLQPVLGALGLPADPDCWVSWGDEAGSRFAILAAAPAGLAVVSVRTSVPQEGPRASGKLVRWARVHLGELDVESQGGHLMASIQLEGQVLRGVDALAERIGAFVGGVAAAIDGRPAPAAPKGAAGRPATPAATSTARPTRRVPASASAAPRGRGRRGPADAAGT
ncbi:MAG TPA: hypothetical protein VF763_08660 [Candidatus Limnocylindrales bacterium]